MECCCLGFDFFDLFIGFDVLLVTTANVSGNVDIFTPEHLVDGEGTKEHGGKRDESPVEFLPVFLVFHERSDNETDHAHELDQNVEGRSRGVLERISNGISNDTGLVCFGSLSTSGSFDFDVLLRVIPGSSSVGHHNGKHHSRDDRSSQKSGQAGGSNEETNSDRRQDGVKSRQDHFFEGRLGGNGNTLFGVSFGSSFAKTRDLSELTANFDDDGTSSLWETRIKISREKFR